MERTLPTTLDTHSMPVSKYIKNFLHTALVLLVLAGIGNIHSHLCLDGQEASVSVHFENLNAHPKHIDDNSHNDFDNEIMAQAPQGKVQDLNLPHFLGSFIQLFILLPPARQEHYTQSTSLVYRSTPSTFLPPLRAPPVLPV